MPSYKRILIKISGEVLMGNRDHGIDPEFTLRLANVLKRVQEKGVGIAVVVGGGNIFRGMKAAANGMDRSRADYIGMLATIMNGLALQDAFHKVNVPCKVISAIDVPQVCERYAKRDGVSYLEEGNVVICTGGTGNPYFTTDSGAALRALELECDVLLKGTKVDGIYDRDPAKYDDAKLYKTVTYQEVIEKDLKVMDQTAFAMARDNGLTIKVFNMTELDNIEKAVFEENFGTTVKG